MSANNAETMDTIENCEKGLHWKMLFPQRKYKQRKYVQSDSEGCKLALHAQNKKFEWYVDNSFSKHLIGDKEFFLNLKEERGGNVYFEENVLAKIIGKGMVTLRN